MLETPEISWTDDWKFMVRSWYTGILMASPYVMSGHSESAAIWGERRLRDANVLLVFLEKEYNCE